MIVRLLIWVIDHLSLDNQRELSAALVDLVKTRQSDGAGDA